MRGEVLWCGHESFLPAALLVARSAWCPVCHAWAERIYMELLAECAAQNAEAIESASRTVKLSAASAIIFRGVR